MDEATIREHAQVHGDAVVSKDLRTAGGYLAPEAMSAAQEVMGQLPKEIDTAEVFDVAVDGDGCTARIRYRGGTDEKVVASRWEDRDGSPKIVELEVL